MEEKHLKLTDTLYKIIVFLPEEEPLKQRIKERALAIMENLVLISVTKENNPHPGAKKEIASQILKDVEVLKSYLKLGKSLGWIDSLNFFILEKEYDMIKEYDEIKKCNETKIKSNEIKVQTEIRKTENAEFSAGSGQNEGKNGEKQRINVLQEINVPQKITVPAEISERQKKIIEFLEKQGRAQVVDVKKIFPDVSKRTLRRDFEDLLKKEKIIRTGEWNQTHYKLDRTRYLS